LIQFRAQRYKNILNYANENAKNVRKICKKVQILTESAIKVGSLPQKCDRKEQRILSVTIIIGAIYEY
jgi:hypothetical protein